MCLDEGPLLSSCCFSVETVVITQLWSYQLYMIDQEGVQAWTEWRSLIRVLSGLPSASCPRWLLFQSPPNLGLISKYLTSPLFGWVCRCSERLQAQSKITAGIPDQQEVFGKCCQHMTANLTCQMLLFKWLLANRLLREPKVNSKLLLKAVLSNWLNVNYRSFVRTHVHSLDPISSFGYLWVRSGYLVLSVCLFPFKCNTLFFSTYL